MTKEERELILMKYEKLTGGPDQRELESEIADLIRENQILLNDIELLFSIRESQGTMINKQRDEINRLRSIITQLKKPGKNNHGP